MGASGITLQYPSADFPALSAFRLDVAAGWSGVVVADALMAVRRDEPTANGYRPNVLVNVHRLARSADPEADLDRLLEGDASMPFLTVVEDRRREDDPVPARSRHFTYLGPNGYELAARRLMLMTTVSERIVDVVSAIGTWAAGDGDDVAAEVEAVVGSLKVAVPRQPAES